MDTFSADARIGRVLVHIRRRSFCLSPLCDTLRLARVINPHDRHLSGPAIPYRYKAARRDITIVYFTAVGLLGVVLALRATPMSGIDESYHFRRALQVSQGGLLATSLGPNDWGGKLDSRMLAYEAWFNDRRNTARVSLTAEAAQAQAAIAQMPPGRQMASFPSTASYPPLPYVPAALGLLLGKLLSLPLEAQVQAGRLGALAGWLALVALVTRVLPAGRFGALALLTMPAAIGVAASFSADPVTNGLSCLFVAVCLRLQTDATCPLTPKRKTALLIVAACLGLLKLTCALLALAVILVPARCFTSARNAWLFRGAAILLAFASAGAWNAHFKFVPGAYWGYGAQPHVAVAMILAAPLHHMHLVVANISGAFYTYWSDAFARFGNGPLPLWMWFDGRTTQLALLVLLGLAVSDQRLKPQWRPALLLAVLGAAYAVQTVLAFKIGFSRPDATIIEGVQGRYWIIPYVLLYLGAVLAVPAPHVLRAARIPCLLAWLTIDVDFIAAALRGYAANWH